MRNSLLLFIVGLVPSAMLSAQAAPSGTDQLPSILARSNDRDLHKREAAFNHVMALISEGQKQATEPDRAAALTSFFKQHPEQADRIKLGLIPLLKADNVDFPGGTYTEDDMNHYAEAVDVVSSLKDERGIPALVGATATGEWPNPLYPSMGTKLLHRYFNSLRV
jgi:hypothetical protein